MADTRDLPRLFRDRCETIARQQREALGLPPFAPLAGAHLAGHHGVLVKLPHEVPSFDVAQFAVARSKWDGMLLLLEPPLILLHPCLPPARRESTIMHEMAHFLLQHRPAGFDVDTGLPIRRPQDEREAAYLGGCLQVPRVAIVWARQTGLNALRAAAHFGASEQMITYRTNVTGERLCRKA